jgi:hypothetical protein
MRILKIVTFGCLLALAFSLLCADTGPAQDVVEGKYFTVYYGNCDLAEIARKLDAEHFLHIDVFSRKHAQGDFNSVIADLFDSIYLEVSDILDIHMYSFKGTVHVLPSRAGIKDLLAKYMVNPPDMPSFYFQEKNTIYISFTDMSLGMLSHEIAHAIISNYFVVLPPVKVQEVLAGYVEYSIRKSTGTLPASGK